MGPSALVSWVAPENEKENENEKEEEEEPPGATLAAATAEAGPPLSSTPAPPARCRATSQWPSCFCRRLPPPWAMRRVGLPPLFLPEEVEEEGEEAEGGRGLS